MKSTGNAPAAGTQGLGRGAGQDNGDEGAKAVTSASKRIGTIKGRITQSKQSVSSLPTGEWGYPIEPKATGQGGKIPVKFGK